MIKILFAASILLSCAENPIVPEEPEVVEEVESVCSSIDKYLPGSWKRDTVRDSLRFQARLTITKSDTECTYSYLVNTYILNPPNSENPKEIHASQGEIVVDQVHTVGDLINFYYEGRRFYLWILDHHGNPYEDSSIKINKPSVGKLWHDQLVLWDNQYERKNKE